MLLIGAACSSGHAHKLTAAASSSTTTSTAPTENSSSTTGAVPAPVTTRVTVTVNSHPTPTTAKASAPPPTTEAPNLSNDNVNFVVVTEADNGKTFTLHRGDQGVEVQLSNDNVWSEPQASDAQVLNRTDGSANGDGSAHGTFIAAGDGQATVTAQGRPHPCSPEPCASPNHVVAFQVTVNVVG